MYRCIKARGYLGLFDVTESSSEYIISEELALAIKKKNLNKRIPIVISHINYKSDLTVGFVTDLKIDNKGLYCEAIIDNITFIEIQACVNEDFIHYFTHAAPSPFLYLKSCFPSFSLSHNRKTLGIKHVALVDVGARRGTLVTYEYINWPKPSQYNCSDKDIYTLLVCYTRNAIKIASERKDLLFKDVLLCEAIDDMDFITAGKGCEKKTIKTSSNSLHEDVNLNMNNNSNIDEALQYLGRLASALNEEKTNLKRKNDLEHVPVPKRKCVNHEPVINAAQTLYNSDSEQEMEFNFRNEMKELRNEMKDILNTQTGIFKEFMNNQQNQNTSYQRNFPYGMHNSNAANNNLYPGMAYNNQVPNSMYVMPQNEQRTPFQHATGQRLMPTTPPYQNTIIKSVPQHVVNDNQMPANSSYGESHPSTSIEKSSNLADNDSVNRQQEPTSNQQSVGTEHLPQTSSEELLIQAGVNLNSNEHLINELFKQFLQTTFHVKQV